MAANPGPLRPHEERRSYARRERPPALPGAPSLGDTFLIVTEGKVTEKRYFEKIRARLKIGRQIVEVVHPNCTDALGLVQKAMACVRQPPKFDHIWVLFDTDALDYQQFKEVVALAEKGNIHLGYSTPCVEFWLLLHFRDRPGPLLNCDAAADAITREWGNHYDKTAPTFSRLWDVLKQKIPGAVARAAEVRRHHESAGTGFPWDPSTELDLLIGALNEAVQPERRI